MRTLQKRLLMSAVCLVVASGGAAIAEDDGGASVVDVPECRVLFVKRVPLASARSGILDQVAPEGEPVESGEVVAMLQDGVPRSALAVAAARAASDVDVRLAEKEHAQALSEYEAGLAANRESGDRRPAYPDTEITRRRLASEAAALQVEQAQRDLDVLRKARDEAEAELQSYTVTSPISGVVVRTLKQAGEGVQQSEPIVEIVNAETLRVEGFIPLNAVAEIRVGMRVEVYADLSGPEEPDAVPVASSDLNEAGPYQGRLGFVDLAVQPVARSVRVWAEVDNSDGHLRDGMTARMRILLEPAPRIESDGGHAARSE